MLDITRLLVQVIILFGFSVISWFRYPLNYEECIVLAQEVIVATLLCEIGAKEILVSNQRILLVLI